MVLVFGFVGGVLGAMVGPGVAATVGAALAPGVGSVGEAPKAVDVSPAVNARPNSRDTPKRVIRDDVIPVPVLSGSADMLPHARARTSRPIVDCGLHDRRRAKVAKTTREW
jgi:hypothetical protein